MTKQIVPYILAGWPSSVVGDIEATTHPLDVAEFATSTWSVWRGPVLDGSIGFTFEESNGYGDWVPCAGALEKLDPGSETETVVTLHHRRRWFRLRVSVPEAGAAAMYRVSGHFNRQGFFDDAGAAVETASVGDGDGASGYSNNVRTATVGATEYAFVSAGPDGIHVIEVGDLRVPGGLTYRATISDSTLGGSTELAGGRSDALAVVDGTHLVSVAVGSGAVDANGNGVTVFDIATIDSVLQGSTPYDFQTAVLPRAGAGVIAAPGVSGLAGGVSGDSARFAVATGTTNLGVAQITSGSPGSWATSSPIDLSVDDSYDVVVDGGTAYVSARSGTTYGVAVVDMDTPDVSSLHAVSGLFARYADSPFAGPGSYALSLALLDDVLLIGGDNEIVRYDMNDPDSPEALDAVGHAGVHAISIAAGAGVISVGGDFELRTYERNGGHLEPLTRNRQGAPCRALGTAVRTDGTLLCCAGYGGLRGLRPGR